MGLRAGSDLCDGLISCSGRIHMFQLVNANETGEGPGRLYLYFNYCQLVSYCDVDLTVQMRTIELAVANSVKIFLKA